MGVNNCKEKEKCNKIVSSCDCGEIYGGDGVEFTYSYGDDVEKTIKEQSDKLYLQSIRKYNYYKAGCGQDAYNVSVKVLRELYPDGVEPKQYEKMLVVWEIVRKLVVVARHGQPATGDGSVFSDVAGWALRAMVDEEVQRKRREDE
jgi:hypothetical protein